MSIKGFTDIHCHIIPTVDDGAQNMKEARDVQPGLAVILGGL